MPAKTILLVEDDPAVREALEQALAFENYQVVPACDPQQAMRRFAENHIDTRNAAGLMEKPLDLSYLFQKLAALSP